MTHMVVFTDLDGTLLDHENYSFAPARPALEALKANKIPLVLASSKTAQEISVLHQQLELGTTPAIVENGAGLFEPDTDVDAGDDQEYQKIRRSLDQLDADVRAHFTGFGDLSADDVATQTGLSPEAARAAKARQYSEPGLWQSDETELKRFVADLETFGISARQGGRFLTLSFGATKADQMRILKNRLKARKTIALGDAPNDAEMLIEADIGIIVRNDHGAGLPTLQGEATDKIRRTAEPGPTGWNKAILELLDQDEQLGET